MRGFSRRPRQLAVHTRRSSEGSVGICYRRLRGATPEGRRARPGSRQQEQSREVTSAADPTTTTTLPGPSVQGRVVPRKAGLKREKKKLNP